MINDKPNMKVSGGIYVVPNEDYVNTRFFFVYDYAASVNQAAGQSAFAEKVRATMSAYGC